MPALHWVSFAHFRGVIAHPPGPASAPVVVLRDGNVWDADRPAAAVGVRRGQNWAAVRTLCPGAERRTFDPVGALPALEAAWDLLAAASAVVEPDAAGRPDAYLAWRDPSPPLPEIRSLLATTAKRLPHVDLAIGLGPTRLTAAAACPPDGGFGTVAHGGEAAFLAPRPLRDLVEQGLIAPALHRRLLHLGLQCCGQLAALPEAAVRARFGRDGLRLRELCRGRDDRPVRALYPPPVVTRRRRFADGLPASAWAAAAADLARKAAAGLAPGQGTRALSLRGAFGEASRSWKTPHSAAAVLGRAAAEVAARFATGGLRLTEVLEVRLEALAPIPIAALHLLPPRIGEAGPQRPAIDDLLARLPRGRLRRGSSVPTSYETLLAMLDPWRDAR